MNRDEITADVEAEHRRLSMELGRISEWKGKQDAFLDEMEAMPAVFQLRVSKFIATMGTPWLWRFGDYELLCIRDGRELGVMAANFMAEQGFSPNMRSRNRYNAGELDAVYDFIADLEPKDAANASSIHTPNSWGTARRIGFLWATDPSMVFYEHAAMSPLIGCEEAGCPHPVPEHLVIRMVELGYAKEATDGDGTDSVIDRVPGD